MLRFSTRRVAVATLLAALLAAATFSAASARRSDLDIARAATARFNSIEQAERAGYAFRRKGRCTSASRRSTTPAPWAST